MATPYNTYPYYSVKSPQQMQQELTSILQNQYAPAYNMLQQNIQSPIPNQPSTSGIYDKVSTYQDVENYPTPTNGTAVLLFNYDDGVFYSKKFVNGQSTIQPFKFLPLNSSNTANVVESEPVKDAEKELDFKEMLQKLSNKFDALEKKFNALKSKPITTRKDLLKEDSNDEI